MSLSSQVQVANRKPANAEVLRTHRMSALAETLRHAQSMSPYYADLMTGMRISEGNATELLRSLPDMRASEWEAARGRIRTELIDEVAVGYTSGTTSDPKAFLSTSAERKAFMAAPWGNSDTSENILYLLGVGHGFPPGEDLGPGVTRIPFIHPQPHFANAARLLERREAPYSAMPPFGVLCGILRKVKELSLFLLRRGVRLDDLGVKRIMIFTQMLSPRWRRQLEGWWGAEVAELYGFSELSMCNSRICLGCSRYHLPPTCLGEFLDLEDGAPVTGGTRHASLAVTAFYPFVQLEPRIRYRPGDIVELADEPCPLWDERGFTVLGRESHAVRLASHEWITTGECFRVIADHPDVSYQNPTATLTGEVMYHECGSPQFRLEKNPDGATLHIELRYDPAVWSHKAQIFRDQVTENLATHRVSVKLHAPGTLPGNRFYV